MTNKPVSLLIIGAGGRGKTYASYAEKFPDKAKVVGVAEPRSDHRKMIVDTHSIGDAFTFTTWEEAVDRPKFADAVIISTQDSLHVEPTIAFSQKGYAVLLEKPMAPSERECFEITRAVKNNGILFAVCHVMRYTSFTKKLKSIVDSGLIGEIVSIQHLEPVGYWHQAHSFVRGNWRSEKESSFMLLAKSCHDLDWIRYILGSACRSVSSFGSLFHFRKENQPEGASDNCLKCQIEPQCPYSAKKIYLNLAENGYTYWPVDVLDINPTKENIYRALESGPYGRCVYACDNDVVDHQIVNMEFAKGQTATFTMTAFSEMSHRKTRIFGTRGELYGDGVDIEHYDFLTDEKERISTAVMDASIVGGHAGGDFGLMEHFINAVANEDTSYILSGPDESLETHRMVFAAELARKEHRVVDMTVVGNLL